jgi:hypothetical protein
LLLSAFSSISARTVSRARSTGVDDAPAERGAMSSKRWMTSIRVSLRALPANR